MSVSYFPNSELDTWKTQLIKVGLTGQPVGFMDIQIDVTVVIDKHSNILWGSCLKSTMLGVFTPQKSANATSHV